MADTESKTPAAGAGAAGAGAVTVDDKTKRAIKKQVHFYFSAHNLPRDNFMKANMNDERWITVETLLKFNRLTKISKDAAVITAALADSEQVEISEDGKSIRNKQSLEIKDFSANVIYAKGFPQDASLEAIEAVFAAFGPVGRVDMRRVRATKAFKGSVFVTFSNTADAEKAIAGPVNWDGKPVEKVMWRSEYLKLKRGSGTTAEAEGPAFTGTERITGALLRVDVADMRDVSQYELREALSKHGDMKFFEADGSGGVARFGNENDAVAAKKGMEEAATKFADQLPTYKVLEGDDATAYWDKVDSMHKKRWQEMQNRKRGKTNKRRRAQNGGRSGKAKQQRTD